MGGVSREEWQAYKTRKRAERSCKVYRLRDPQNRDIRYIGQTERALQQRLQEHIRGAQASRSMRTWIQELQSVGLIPLIETIEENLTQPEAERQETYWIKHYISSGAKLFNISHAEQQTPQIRHAGQTG